MSCLRCAPDSSHSDISNQARHLDLLILKLCVFLVFYSYLCAKHAYFSRAGLRRHYTAPAAAVTLNMHETRATAIFALALPHPIWKGLLFVVFYNMSCLRCAPDSSHSDNSRGHALHTLCPALACPALASCLLRVRFCAHPISRGGMGEALWMYTYIYT